MNGLETIGLTAIVLGAFAAIFGLGWLIVDYTYMREQIDKQHGVDAELRDRIIDLEKSERHAATKDTERKPA
jgi:hypothetical protein